MFAAQCHRIFADVDSIIDRGDQIEMAVVSTQKPAIASVHDVDESIVDEGWRIG